MNTRTSLQAQITLSDSCVEAHLSDARNESLALFAALDEAQRVGLATDAWTIGLRALTNAYRQAEEARLGDIGKELLEDVDQQLGAYVERQNNALVDVLHRYFDPKDGKIAQRIDGFVQDGGELSRVLGGYFSPEHGALARTLAQQLGENSPLLRRLSPTDSQGVVCLIEKKIEEQLRRNNDALSKALDPLAEDGAVARLFRSLRAEMANAEQDRTKQLALATKALDANDEGSLLSRLMRETQAARSSLLRAFNVDEPGSPLAVLRTSLTKALEEHAKGQAQSLALMDERQRKLDQDIRESIARLEERKHGDARSTRGGFTFEEAVVRFIQRAVSGAPLIAEPTGRAVGACRGSKVGDLVLRFTNDSLFEGATIVVEAKRDLGFTETKALRELEEARANRTASVGLFVMAKSHAPIGFPGMVRRGQDVIVTWDAEDESTDPYLLAALFLAMALVTRQRRPGDAGDLKALADIESRIHHELARFEEMKKLAETIRGAAEKLEDKLRKGSDKLGLLLRNAKKTLKALDVELTLASDDVQEPIALALEALEDGRESLDAAE
jgi:hypothetical protein